ncbi:MAG: DUF4352 domain-containing protein [Armatimonadota bacterium]
MNFIRNSKFVLAATLLLIITTAAVFAAGSPSVYLNDTKVNVTPVVKNYVNYLSIKTLSSLLQTKIQYTSPANCVKVNGEIVRLKADPITRGGQTYLPVASVVKAAGGTVYYDASTNALRINCPDKASTSSTYEKTEVIKIKPVDGDEVVATETIIIKKTTETKQTTTTQETSSKDDDEDDESKPFIPRSASNDVFKVTVTNMEVAQMVKGNYSAKPGFKFVVVYFSQHNISDQLQTYLGRFRLKDDQGKEYGWITGLSNIWVIALKPGGTNFGYLVFEIPAFAYPEELYLDLDSKPSISVSLKK